MGDPGYVRQFYLWDEGVLLATYDYLDEVNELFMHGPEGRFATMIDNDPTKLHYFLNDQIGSPRVTMAGQPGTTPTVSQWIHNHPFGGLASRSGSYLTDFRFTGHEYDEHSTFGFHYMGARYYDDRIGSFTSIDKASQFASGFNYGGNNPILGSDPDGEWFWAAIKIAWDAYHLYNTAKTAYGIGKAAYKGDMQALGESVMGYGASYISSSGMSPMADKLNVNFGTSFAGDMATKMTNSALNSASSSFIIGSMYNRQFDWRGGLDGLRQGAVAGAVGSFYEHLSNKATNLGWRSNDLIETPATVEAGGAARWAHRKHDDGSTEYNKSTPHPTCPDGPCSKCNFFVGDSYTEGGGLSRSVDGVNGYPTYPESNDYARANDMGNMLPGGEPTNYDPRTFQVIDLEQIRAGDVVIFPNADGSGHMGIMGFNRSFISAYNKGITAPNLMARIKEYKNAGRNVVIRRYKKF